MDLAPDFDEFIGSLIAQEVEFLIVGAYALAFHGAPRYTGDIGILIRPTVENARRALAAIAAFGFPISNLKPGDLVDSRRMLEMGVEPVQIHVMSSISGVTWEEAWEGRVIGSFGHREAPLIGRNAFLQNKRAAGGYFVAFVCANAFVVTENSITSEPLRLVIGGGPRLQPDLTDDPDPLRDPSAGTRRSG